MIEAMNSLCDAVHVRDRLIKELTDKGLEWMHGFDMLKEVCDNWCLFVHEQAFELHCVRKELDKAKAVLHKHGLTLKD